MGSAGKDAAADAKEAAEQQLTEYKEQQALSKAAVEKQKQAYKDIEITSPYADMENVYEDMTINQQQAQFQAQQGAQQRANIMQGLRGAAGGSGVAGLAQAMAGQGQLQAQQISASIGMQESQQQQLKARGAADVQLQERQGEAMVQQAQTGRAATLLGMEYGELAGAQAGVQAAYGNVQSAAAMEMERINANKAMWASIGGSALGAAGTAIASDRRLKKNINKIGESPSGLNIYSFEYKNTKHGKGLFQGVMSDEISQEAVSNVNGYDYVDYNMLDVEFKQI